MNKKFVGPETKYGTKDIVSLLKEIDPLNQYIEIITDAKYENLPYHLNNADIFVAASACESFGLPFKEALINQIPILYQNLESHKEIKETIKLNPNVISYNDIENEFKDAFLQI